VIELNWHLSKQDGGETATKVLGKLDQQAALQRVGNEISGQATPSSFAASGNRAFGEGAAKGTFADAAPLSSQSRNALPSGVICQPALSRKPTFD
jgi:hypothetical protein